MATNREPAEPVITRPVASSFGGGASVGIGSLPHLDPEVAAAFAIDEFDIATVPTLPRRSIAETMIAQAVLGLPGITIDRNGVPVLERSPHGADVGFAADSGTDPIVVDVDHEAFRGLRAFCDLAVARGLDGTPVKWQFVGPVTLGVALINAGVDARRAFDAAGRIVRAHVLAMSEAITAVVPSSPQMVLLDEPWLSQLMTPGFPISPEHAIDLMSGAMAALPPSTVTGIHCCAPCDIATLLATGPRVISVPVADGIAECAGYLERFLDEGGIVAWGAVPTDGPIALQSDRLWRLLSDLWCSLVQRGCDPVLLRRQSLVTPQCGLAWHSVSVARRIARLTADIGKRVKGQSAATRFALGA